MISCFWSVAEHTFDELHVDERHVVSPSSVIGVRLAGHERAPRAVAGTRAKRLHQRLARPGGQTAPVEFRVLGSVGIVDGDQLLPVGGEKPRRLLAHAARAPQQRRLGRAPDRRALDRSARRRRRDAPELRLAAAALRRARRRAHVAAQPRARLRARGSRRSRRRGPLRARARRRAGAARHRSVRGARRSSTPRSPSGAAPRSRSSPTRSGSGPKRSASTSCASSRPRRGSTPSCASATTNRSSASSKRSSSTIRCASASAASSCSRSYRSGRQAEALRAAHELRQPPARRVRARAVGGDPRSREPRSSKSAPTSTWVAPADRRPPRRRVRHRRATPRRTFPRRARRSSGASVISSSRPGCSSRAGSSRCSGRAASARPGSRTASRPRSRPSSPTACGSSSSRRCAIRARCPPRSATRSTCSSARTDRSPTRSSRCSASQQLLLVLDNCEHVLDTTSELVELILRWCPNVHVLATSREPLGIPAEVVWSVPPLPVPAESRRAGRVAGRDRRGAAVRRAGARRAPRLRARRRDRGGGRGDLHPPRRCPARARARGGAHALDEPGAARRAASRALPRARRIAPRDRSAPPQPARPRAVVVRAAHRAGAARVRTAVDVRGFVRPRTGRARVRGRRHRRGRRLRACSSRSSTSRWSSPNRRGRARATGCWRRCASSVASGWPNARSTWRRHAAHVPRARRARRAGRRRARRSRRGALGRGARRRRSTTCAKRTRRALADGDVDRAIRLVVALREYAWRRIRYELLAWADATVTDAGRRPSTRCIPVALGVVAYGRFVRGELDAAVEAGERAVAAADRLGTPTMGSPNGRSAMRSSIATARPKPSRWMDRMVDAATALESPSLVAHAYYMRSVAETSLGNTRRRRRARASGRRPPPTSAGARPRTRQAAYALGVSFEKTDPDACAAPPRPQRAARRGGRQPLDPRVRAHREPLDPGEVGTAARRAARLPRRDRHVVPRRRLGQPVALAAARVRDLRVARQRRGRGHALRRARRAPA